MKTTMRNPILVGVTLTVALCCSGCGDSSNVAALQARIDALEKQQKADGAKLASMSEKIVTKEIDVSGRIKAEQVSAGLLKATGDPGQSITIGFFGIEIDSRNAKGKTGSVARMDSSGLGFYDYQSSRAARFAAFTGNAVEMGVNAKGGLRSPTEVRVTSSGSNDDGVSAQRDLSKARTMRDDVLWNRRTAADEGFSVIDAENASLALRFRAISEEGIMRFEIANFGAISLSGVRGVVAYGVMTGDERQNRTASFVVDQRMESGKWVSVSVLLEADGKKIDGVISIKDLKVNGYLFSK